MDRPRLKEIDTSERGAERDGKPQLLDRRLFMQLLVFRCDLAPAESIKAVTRALEAQNCPAVLYEDLSDPLGVGLLTWSENPTHFVDTVRPIVADPELGLEHRPEMTMVGRTYSIGYEPDLEHWLLRRSIEVVSDEKHDWAVWYPLRRSGAFERLDGPEQAKILREHGAIGRAYGEKGLASDVRLACHGLDTNDNDFVIGLVGKELFPLSHVVQSMRKTRQTSEFITQMGPFFVGRVISRRS